MTDEAVASGDVEAGPVPETERIASLDALRGAALFGILLVNVESFGLPLATITTSGPPPGSAGDTVAWSVVQVLVRGKFVSLFSFLFGAGLALTWSRAAITGRSFTPLAVRRLAVLASIGLVHGLLVWYGDILFLYAVLGFILLACQRFPPRTLLWLAGGCLGLFMVVVTGFSALDDVLGDPLRSTVESPTLDSVDGLEPRGMRAIVAASFDPSSSVWVRAETEAYSRGPFQDALAFRAVSFAFMLLISAVSYAWYSLGLFLAGAAVVQLGFFSPASTKLHQRLLVGGLAIGLTLELVALGIQLSGAPAALAAPPKSVGMTSLSAAYVGGGALLVHSGRAPRLVGALSLTGRMALTNYLGQSVVATFFFYWWGLGLFGALPRLGLLAVAVALFAAQVVLSHAWLSRFTMGPLEWLWRGATYGRLPQLRRAGR